ncbi:helix-turn-helix transcriptional regulator [Pseudonocardia humida]|uniref:YafY family transcriptional regulator n=1 Tax=Pseudonocardia humida TaxID=2800819 RepID=A0ABT0ZZ30_9PSEU|nr:YafY family protein [Pseudonocardia humida]MCO1655938.1 YafY family transcriptional regulator [Pseudonocardia humida]
MRASRLVEIVLLLQTRGKLTAQQLADALEVSVRTVYRDMEALSAAGVPVYAGAGHSGGYQLVDGYRTRLTGLTTGEAESLFLAGLPGAASDLGLGATAGAARLKLMAALPEPLRGRAARTASRFHLDAPSWYRDAEAAPHLTAVADAVWNQRRLRLRYERWAEPRLVEPTVEPYGLVLKAGHWYLVAAEGGRHRTYRVARILDAVAEPDPFDRDESFDLAAHWEAYRRDFDQRRLSGRAVLRVSPATLAALPDLVEPAFLAAAQRTAVAEADGWTRVEVPVEAPGAAVGQLLRLGAGIEVLGPPELRARIARTVAALATAYQGSGAENSAPGPFPGPAPEGTLGEPDHPVAVEEPCPPSARPLISSSATGG